MRVACLLALACILSLFGTYIDFRPGLCLALAPPASFHFSWQLYVKEPLAPQLIFLVRLLQASDRLFKKSYILPFSNFL